MSSARGRAPPPLSNGDDGEERQGLLARPSDARPGPSPHPLPANDVSTSQEGPEDRGRYWCRFFLLYSTATVGLFCLTSILRLLTLSLSPLDIFIDSYIVVLGFFAWSAELRQYSLLRPLVYHWVHYVYFVSTYTGRGLLYVFLGTLMWQPSSLVHAALALATAVQGVLLLGINACVGLPSFTDVEEQRRQAEYDRRHRSPLKAASGTAEEAVHEEDDAGDTAAPPGLIPAIGAQNGVAAAAAAATASSALRQAAATVTAADAHAAFNTLAYLQQQQQHYHHPPAMATAPPPSTSSTTSQYPPSGSHSAWAPSAVPSQAPLYTQDYDLFVPPGQNEGPNAL